MIHAQKYLITPLAKRAMPPTHVKNKSSLTTVAPKFLKTVKR
jgi:hypothetical protein